MTWAINHGQPIENVGEEVSIVTQLDEERKWLWELPNTTSKKPRLDRKIMLTSSITKWIFKEGNKVRLYIVWKVHSKYKRRRKEVKHKKFYIYIGLPKSLKVHPIFHVSVLKQIVQNLSRWNRHVTSTGTHW
jgi:hypothetical protein